MSSKSEYIAEAQEFERKSNERRIYALTNAIKLLCNAGDLILTKPDDNAIKAWNDAVSIARRVTIG